jgi:hypothetical protein
MSSIDLYKSVSASQTSAAGPMERNVPGIQRFFSTRFRFAALSFLESPPTMVYA